MGAGSNRHPTAATEYMGFGGGAGAQLAVEGKAPGELGVR